MVFRHNLFRQPNLIVLRSDQPSLRSIHNCILLFHHCFDSITMPNLTYLSFITFLIDYNATKVKGRFFYVLRTELLNCNWNYKGNFGFIVFLILIIAYALLSMVLGCYDNIYFVKETLLESLKEELLKSFFPYRSRKCEKEALK